MPWITSRNNGMFCERCFTFESLNLPIPLDDVKKNISKFAQEHFNCKDNLNTSLENKK